MLIASHTFKNVKLEIQANKVSTDGIYIDSDNFITLDANWLQKQCYNIWDSPSNPKRSKKVTNHKINLVASSKAELSAFCKKEDLWVLEQTNKIKKSDLGGIKTLLMKFK